MKKKAVLFISLLALLSGMLSLPALATQQAAGSQAPAVTTTPSTPPTTAVSPVTDPPATATPPVATPPATTPAAPTTGTDAPPAADPNVEVAPGPAVTPVFTIPLTSSDVIITSNVANLTQQFCTQSKTMISNCTSFPVVLNMTAVQNATIDTIVMPKELIVSVCTAYQTASGQSTLSPEALRIVTGTHEQVWTISELELMSDPAVLVLQSTVPTQTTTPTAPSTSAAPTQPAGKPKVTVEFTLDEDEDRGVLFVSKDAAGQWQVTDQNLYSSALPYVLIAILLVVIALVAIVAVNLIIIKVYRAHN